MDTTEIKEILQIYFDASFESSEGKMAQVFHDAAHIYGHSQDGNLSDSPKEAFVKMVGRKPVNQPPYPREDEILSIDFTGENTAVARVKIRVNNTMFTDILSFIKIDGKWSVIAKLYSGVQA